MINYYLLTKPGIVLGNLFPFAAGFLLASRGTFDVWLFLTTLLGLTLIMASACVFNNYIDRQTDKKMERTKNRPLPTGRISNENAILFATLLGLLGFLVLLSWTNLVAVAVAGVGFFVYVVLYSLWKCRTIYGTAIGSIAGAVPPIVGYCAVSNHFDLGALILFAMLVLWQMPHFFAIALYHFNDYVAAGIPVLPVKKGMLRTKVHMVLYIASFTLVAMMLTFFHYTGYLYLTVALIACIIWLLLSLQGFKRNDETSWGKAMFRLSLVIMATMSLVIPLDVV